MDYKPYSQEWHRKRSLKEALDLYFDDYVENDVIYNDLMDILHERSEEAYATFEKTNELESRFHS